jgi:hypothetical protein
MASQPHQQPQVAPLALGLAILLAVLAALLHRLDTTGRQAELAQGLLFGLSVALLITAMVLLLGSLSSLPD